MPEDNASLHISEVCQRLSRFAEGECKRLASLSDAEREASADKAAERPDLLGAAARWISRKTGLPSEDALIYIHRSGTDCHWGEWRREGHGETWPDISPIAEKMADWDARGLTPEFVAWIQQEYPDAARALTTSSGSAPQVEGHAGKADCVPPRVLLAHESYEWVCREWPDLVPTDRKMRYAEKMYNCVKELCPSYTDKVKCPSFGTWKRHIREYERLTKGPKNSPRAGRETGHSVVTPEQV